MRYDAFISYRHSPLDMEIAKKVHTGLETYHVPGAVRKKTGKKKIQRVFRDQEELPIGSDLNDNISGALAQSEYLIVICSPRTPESYWVCKEIESFIQMHDREHVLAVLIEGEPDESFPPQLLTDENGNPVEPLAADVRGADKKEMNKKFKTEILRLAAPVLGCSYDDLRQRHRERIIKRTIAMVSAGAAVLALAGTAFGLYNAVVAKQMEQLANEKSQLAAEKTQLADEKTQLAEEILLEYKDKQKNQSRFYAEKSLSLMKQGYREDAVLVAKEGLPYEGNDRPYVPEAEYALSEALGAYASDTEYGYDRVLKHEVRVDKVKVDKESTKVVVLDKGDNIYIWDTQDWSLKARIPAEFTESNEEIAVINFGPLDDGVAVIRQNGYVKYDFDGNEISRIEAPTEVFNGAVSEAGKKVAMIYTKPEESDDPFTFLLPSEQKTVVEIISTDTTGRISYELDYRSSLEERVQFTRDGSKFITADIPLMTEPKDKKSRVDIYDIQTGELKNVQLSGDYMFKMAVTNSGHLVCLTHNEASVIAYQDRDVYMDVIDPVGANIMWKKTVHIDAYSALYGLALIKSSKFKMAGEDFTGIDLIYGNTAYMFDVKDGSMVSQTNMSGMAEGFVTYVDSNEGLIAYSNGNMEYIDFEKGQIKNNSLQSGKTLEDLIPCAYNIILVPYNSSELFVCNVHKASDYKEIVATDRIEYAFENSQKNDYLITQCFEDDSLSFYDKDGTLLYREDCFEYISFDAYGFKDDKAIFINAKDITVIDPKNKKTDVYSFEDLFNEKYFSINDAYISDNGKYAVLWSSGKIRAMDLDSMEVIYSWDWDYFSDEDQYIKDVLITEDGSRLYLFREDGKLMYSDLSDTEFKSFGGEELQTICGFVSIKRLAVSGDGKKLAVLCIDEKIRIVDTKTQGTIAEIPVLAKTNLFFEFTSDGKYLAVQGDDFILRIWNLEQAASVCEIEMTSAVENMIYDDEDGLVSVNSASRTWLLETESFKLVGSSSSSTRISYLPCDNAIIFSEKGRIYKIRYKDYKQLLEEAERQFPGLTLTEEKKRKYNID